MMNIFQIEKTFFYFELMTAMNVDMIDVCEQKMPCNWGVMLIQEKRAFSPPLDSIEYSCWNQINLKIKQFIHSSNFVSYFGEQTFKDDFIIYLKQKQLNHLVKYLTKY